jgi:hypothetical protein
MNGSWRVSGEGGPTNLTIDIAVEPDDIEQRMSKTRKGK